MLTAYIDESGHEGKNWMFLAGFLGNEEQWKDFVPKWSSGLGPQRKFLHMSSLRWNKDSTRRLLARLAPIPDECKLERVLGGARFGDYEDLISGTEHAKMLKGYISCLFPLVIQTLRGIPANERLELVFEEQREYEPFVHMALPWLTRPDPLNPWKTMKDGRPKLAKWSFVPKGSTLMSDPADYFAFALREAWTDRNSRKAAWCKPMMDGGGGSGYGAIMKREQIRRAVSDAQAMHQAVDELIAKLSGGRGV